MSILLALLLGILQGLTEFLPISSSGHLVLVPFILGVQEPTLAFGVAVHVGTLIAVIRVFRDEVGAVIRTVLGWSRAAYPEKELVRRLAIASVPAAIVGAALNGPIEDAFQRPVLVSVLLGVTGFILLSIETRAAGREEPPREGDEMSTKDAVAMGVGQAFAILPGISRSGATIAAGMRMGLSRRAAARFSFLLAIPIIIGATIVSIPDLLNEGFAGSGPAFVIGVVAAAISGAWAIRWFLGLVERRTLRPFGTYLIFAMVAGLLTALARG